MKWNWGTGIFIFLVLFLAACTAFIIFAMQQDVNLVHKDYYEKGVNYTEQMNTNARSKQYYSSVQTQLQNEYLRVDFEQSLAAKIDSGNVLLYRPSNSNQDIIMPLSLTDNSIFISKSNLVSGRYILKLNWFSDGLKYEIDKPVNIQ
ncbi:MAG: FixH family protein [Draconibacterium sp.]